jgi:TM2 domain-containing membrane protein YozV
MQQKVWEIKDPGAYLGKKKTSTRETPAPRQEKDPAAAYSRSLLFWGLGQLYNDQVVKGTVFMVAMVLAAFGAVLSAVYRHELYTFLLSRNISRSGMFLASEIILLALLLFSVSNAADAYRTAARTRRSRFRGVTSRVTPFLSSLLLPGWGQFLNGQPIKGSIFSVLAVIVGFSVFSVVLTFLVWPLLDGSDALFTVEEIFAVCLLLAPFMPLLWTFGAWDALKVSREELLKEPLWERIKAAYYRGRTQGIVRGIFPQIRGTFLLVLLLAIFVLVVMYWFPAEYYTKQLMSVQKLLGDRGFSIVPELISRLLETAGWK